MSISSRISSMEEHLKESYQELEGIGIDTTGVNNNLENIPKLLDGYWETLPKATGEGTSITLDNTKEGKMKVLLKGNTYQDSTSISGGDAYDSPTPEYPQEVHVVSGDNEVEVVGKNIFDKSSATLISKTIGSNTRYGYKIPKTTQDFYISKENDEGSFGLYEDIEGTMTLIKSFATTTKDITNSNNDFYIIVTNTTSQSTAQSSLDSNNFMISYEDTTYIPYTSASYPINLPEGMFLGSIGDYQDRFFKTSGKNIYNPSNLKIGSINTTTGQEEISYYYSISQDFIEVEPSQAYSFQYAYNYSSITGQIVVYQYDANKSFIRFDASNTKDYNLTLRDNTKYVKCRFKGDTNHNNNVSEYEKMQIAKGTSIPYEPYGSNEWYLEKKIGKVVLDGTETGWSSNAFAGGERVYRNITDAKTFDSNINYKAYSNYFYKDGNVFNSALAKNGMFCQYPNTNQVYFMSNETSLENFKTWLSTHNTIVYYVLSTPTYTKITGIYPTLHNQLEALNGAKSYTGQTNISQNNNDMASVLNATALSNGTVTPSLQGVQTLSLGQNVDLQPQEPIEEQTEEVEEQGEEL